LNQIGIITALMPEAACLTREPLAPGTLTRLDNNITLYVCGVGAERAQTGARALLQAGADVLVSFGTAGAVSRQPEPGDLCVPESVIGYDGHVYETSKHWCSAVVNKLVECPCDIYLGQMADSMRILATTGEKAEAGEQHKGVIAVDMESAAIAEVAMREEKTFIVLRVIVDSANMNIPEIAVKLSDPYGRVRFTGILQQTLLRPHQIPSLIALARGYRKAIRTMRWIGERLPILFS
jgi:adenosylhomocysteine nucleosidase